MIEILNIIIQILFILTILIFPIIFLDTNNYSKNLEINLFDKISVNSIFFMNFIFLSSIANINLKYILYLYFFLLIIFLFINRKNISLSTIKINYFFVIFILFIFLISIDIADQLYFEWDVKSIWHFKALNFYQNQNIENLNNFKVSEYPHLGSFFWSFFWMFPYSEYEYLGRIFYAFIYVLSIFSISNCLKVELNEKLIFSILLILLTYNYRLFSGLQDVLIFSIILFFSRATYLLFEKKNRLNNYLLISIILAIVNLLFWIKNEGIFYGLFLVFSLLITYNLTKKEKIFLIFGSIIILTLKVSLFIYYNNELNPQYFQMEETLSFDLILILEKVKIVTFYIFVYSTQNSIYLIVLPILFYMLIKYPRNQILNFTIYFLLLNILFIYFAYMFKMTEVELLIKASMQRTMFQTSGFYFLIIIIYINHYMASKFKKKIS